MPRTPRPTATTVRREAAERLGSSTLRPGFLVSLKTSVTGNVTYNKDVIEPEHRTRTGAARSKWQTERITEDPEEQAKAEQARMKARAKVALVCAKSAFGLLCPENKIAELEAAVVEARQIVAAFNRRSRLTTVGIYVITGRVAQDDVEAVRAISSEVRDLLRNMETGINELNVQKVRAAANKARGLASMLSPEASDRIKSALTAARSVATKIVKAGENAAVQIDREAINTIAQARSAFLDIDMEANIDDVAEPEAETRDVDVPETPEPAEPPVVRRQAKTIAAKGTTRRRKAAA